MGAASTTRRALFAAAALPAIAVAIPATASAPVAAEPMTALSALYAIKAQAEYADGDLQGWKPENPHRRALEHAIRVIEQSGLFGEADPAFVRGRQIWPEWVDVASTYGADREEVLRIADRAQERGFGPGDLVDVRRPLNRDGSDHLTFVFGSTAEQYFVTADGVALYRSFV